MAVATIAPPRRVKWARDEYQRMADMGLFDGKRVELIDGEVIEMSPQCTPHAVAVMLADRLLETAFPRDRYSIRTQMPAALGEESEPEPDLVVSEGQPRDFLGSHPSDPLLVVEVADSSLPIDRSTKARVYASAGVEDYWILNVNDRQLEVHRRPVRDPLRESGSGYSEVVFLGVGDTVSPLEAPQAELRVADLLP